MPDAPSNRRPMSAEAVERVQEYVAQAYPGAEEVGSIRGVRRPRCYRRPSVDGDAYLLGFAVAGWSSMTGTCLKVLAAGDRWIFALPGTDTLFEVILDDEAVAAFQRAEPDRADGDHHIDPARIQAGTVVVSTKGDPIELAATPIASDGVGQFVALCAEFLDEYPTRGSFSGDTPQARLTKRLAASIKALASRRCPSDHWKGDSSYGKGNWVTTPWVGLYDVRVTTRASSGVYPVVHFLFNADEGSPTGEPGIRIGLNVSTTEYQGDARAKRVEAVRNDLEVMGALDRLRHDYWVIGSKDDRPTTRPAKGGLGRDYYEGIILELFAGRSELQQGVHGLPSALDALFGEYKRWVDTFVSSGGHTFLSAVQRYREDGTVFQSSTRGALYAIGAIDDNGCEIERLTANETARCTVSAYDRLVSALEAADGSLPYDRKLLSPVAARTGYLQSSELALSPDRKVLRIVRDDATAAELFCDYLDGLRVDHSSGTSRRYKPALVSCLLEALDTGDLRENRIEFDWILPRFLLRMDELGDPSGEQQAAYAFVYMSNDLFWLLNYRDIKNALDPTSPVSPAELRRTVTHASIKNPFWKALQSAELRALVRKRLAAKWWPDLGGGQMPSQPNATDLNVILYGPPGTGKTFRTVEMAVRICDGNVPSDRHAAVDRFKALRDEGQIEFVTLHQSYGYEDFVEGIRPVLVSPEESDVEASESEVRYECNDGVFKTLCSLAKTKARRVSQSTIDPASTGIWKMSLGNTLDPSEAVIYDECIENNYLMLGYGGQLNFADCDSRDAIEKRLRERDPEIKSHDYNIQAVEAFKNGMQVGDLVVISDGNRKFRAIGKVSGEYLYNEQSTYKQSRAVEWIVVYEESLPRERISTKLFSQMTIHRLRPRNLKLDALREIISGQDIVKRRNYVLIIDEINRGNISKVLGELITLLEPDKRLGRPNELTVTLPYSRDVFGVPDNVYVIGTMNTADRSIAFLDTALRRRFTFLEVMPDVSVVRDLVGEAGVVDGVDIGNLFKTVNARIELLFDRDHQIGHSYFLGVRTLDDLRQVLLVNVIPLLQEYFYGDWAKVAMILGCPFDPETGAQTNDNAHPVLSVRVLKTDELLGSDDSEFEDKVCCDVSKEFVSAAVSELPHFFDGIVGS